jgi:WD40 repeat protein
MIGALIRARQTRAEAILHDDTAVATSVDWSNDGRLLATASENGTVRLWRFGTRERLSPPLQGDGGPLNVVAFDPTRAVVAAGGTDGLFLWWLKDGRAVRRLRVSKSSITALAYGPDGELVAGTEHGALWRWDTPTHSGAELARISGPITAVAVAKDGAIAYANDHAAFVRPRSGRSSVPVAHVPPVVHALAFSPTDPTLVIGGGDVNGTEHIGVVQIVDSATLDPVARTSVEDRPTDFVDSLSFSRDGATLAGAGPDGSVWLWNARTAVKQDRYGADGGHLHAVAFSPTALSMFAAAANYGAILVWKAEHPAFGTPTTDAETGRELATPRAGGVVELSGPHPRMIAGAGDIERVALSDNGEWLAAATSAGLVRVWPTASGGPIARIETGPVTALAVDDKGELVAGGTASGLVRLWDVGAARRVDPALRASSARVDVVAFSPKGAMLATSGEDATTYLWDVRTHRKLAALRVGPQASSLDFSPDGRLLATGQGDGVRLWDTRAHIRLVDHVGSWSVTDVAFSPDGRRLLSRDTDGLHVWDGILWSDYDDLRRQVCSLVFPGIARGAEWRELAPNLGYRETCPSR